jgi:hypothetical protein
MGELLNIEILEIKSYLLSANFKLVFVDFPSAQLDAPRTATLRDRHNKDVSTTNVPSNIAPTD